MNYAASILIALSFIATAAAEPQVDVSEAIRRGDMVEHITGIQITDAPAFEVMRAMQLPEDDSDKWFVSVISTANCQYCEILKKDWENSDYLQSIAIPGDQAESWAHLNYYNYGDKSQEFRWRNIEFRGFPTIIVQPPRNGKYGPPTDIVFHRAGYDGDDQKLTRSIVDAVKLRIKKEAERREVIRGPPSEHPIGVDPPWDPEPRTPREPRRPFLLPDVPPVETPAPFPTWSLPTLFSGGPAAWVGYGAIAWFLFTNIREWRKKRGEELLVNQKMMDYLQSLATKFDIDRTEPKPHEKEEK